MLTVRIQEKNHSESIMVLKLKDGCADLGPDRYGKADTGGCLNCD